MKRILLLSALACTMFAHAQAQCSAAFTYYTNNNLVYFNMADSLVYGTWDFGDGATIYSGSTSHVYNNPGSYQVKHVVTDTLNNCKDSVTKNVVVQFTPQCSAAFVYYADSNHPAQYTFYDRSTIIGSSYLNSQWTINGSVVANNTQSFSHAFTQAGTYNVCEQIQSSSGCSSSSCQDIVITNIDSCDLKVSYSFVADQSNPFALRFIASTDSGTNTKYSWNFDDGTYDSSKNPAHLFAKGVYNVSLTVQKPLSNAAICSASYSSRIYIDIDSTTNSCPVSITYNQGAGSPNQFLFTASCAQPLASADWTIYQGTDTLYYNARVLANLQGTHPAYIFPDTGRYFITLKITTESGCTNFTSQEMFIDSIVPFRSAPNNAAKIPSYPNPATNNVNVNVELSTNNNITVNIYNTMGSLIISKQIPGIAGNNQITVPVQGLRQGIYYMEINYGNEIKRSSFQKL